MVERFKIAVTNCPYGYSAMVISEGGRANLSKFYKTERGAITAAARYIQKCAAISAATRSP